MLALGVDALVVVDVVLPAVLGLVHVREAGVGAYKSQVGVSNIITTCQVLHGTFDCLAVVNGVGTGNFVPAVMSITLASDDQAIA